MNEILPCTFVAPRSVRMSCRGGQTELGERGAHNCRNALTCITACDLLDHSFAPVEPVALCALPSSIILMMSCGSRTGFSVSPWWTGRERRGVGEQAACFDDFRSSAANLNNDALFGVLSCVKLQDGTGWGVGGWGGHGKHRAAGATEATHSYLCSGIQQVIKLIRVNLEE
jgi:hypothetical protein